MISAERFEALCAEYVGLGFEDVSIGTYNEKRLHMMLKRLVCDDPSRYEVRIGKYIADVFEDGHITEIQTGSLYPLREKLAYYLCETEYSVTVVKPVIASKRIVRLDRDTGEMIRSRCSPVKVGISEVMQDIFNIAEFVKNSRINIVVLYIFAEEYRYSDEKFRYRRAGRYDSELFARELLRAEEYCGADSYAFLLDGCENTFSAGEYGRLKGFRGRALYRTLNLLCAIGLLERTKKDSRSYTYRIVED